ncbi:MAG TPA: sulfatase-like hydrolase/transferase [Acidobacteriota bacterium]
MKQYTFLFRTAIRSLLLMMVLWGAARYSSRPVSSAANRPPYVLVIYADQHRFDCLGAAGNPNVKTPYLDSLARDGVLFRNSFCTWPVCTPSRYSLLSGQYVKQHRGRSNQATLLPGTRTFPALLRAAGYSTAAVGKMHFTPAYQDVGFSELQLAEQNGRGRWVDDYHRYLKERGLIDSVDLIDQERLYRNRAPQDYWQTFGAAVSNLPEEHHSTTWIGNRALEQLSKWKPDKPALLMVGFIKPHHPFDPPAPWDRMYDPAALTVLPGWTDQPLSRDLERNRGYFEHTTLSLPALRRVMAYYYAAISQLDAQVGKMLDSLKRKGLYEKTLIVYTADHGEYLGFHHMLLKSNHMYDPLIKVPLIIKYPQNRLAGAVSGILVSSIDVTATILREAALEPAPEMKGRSLYSGGLSREAGRDLVFAEDAGFVMVRSSTRKLLYSAQPGRSLFFDLESDPLEIKNLADDPDRQGEIQYMKEALLRWFQVETETEPHVDLTARQINQPNVPADRTAAEKEMQRYSEEKMRRILGK